MLHIQEWQYIIYKLFLITFFEEFINNMYSKEMCQNTNFI